MMNLFRKIVMICFSFEINDMGLAILEKTIAKFIQMWSSEYKSFPKLHYLVHLPTSIKKFGPAIHFSCFRFEARHQIFKRYARNCGFKNAGYTIATKFQKQCAIPDTIVKNGNKNVMIKNNIEFLIGEDENTVVAFKQSDDLKIGYLCAKNNNMLSIAVFKKFSFNRQLLCYDILDKDTEIIEISSDDIFPFLGHSYFYGVENDEKLVVLFKNILNFDLY